MSDLSTTFLELFEIPGSPFAAVFLAIFAIMSLMLIIGIFSGKMRKFLRRIHLLEDGEDPGSFLLWIVSVVVIIRLVQVFLLQPFLVDGASMAPTFKTNNLLIVDKTYKHRDIKRGDVIVFKFKKEDSNYDGKYFIKRIMALPGEKIIINSGNTIIIQEDGSEQTIDESFVAYKKKIEYLEKKLGKDEYFVMGDNRAGSYDSRAWGPIHKSQIAGEALLQIFPSISAYPGKLDKEL